MLANPAGAVYGLIAVSALLAAESARQETYPRTIGAVVVTLVLYWLAHAYAELAGERLTNGGKLTPAKLTQTMVHEVSLLAGAAVPLAALLILWATGARLSTGVTVAVWTAVATIVIVEVVSAVRAELTGSEFVQQVAFGALLGLLIVALKLLLH